MKRGHILVDFDRTLAYYESWEKNGSSLGAPIPAMVDRVKAWLKEGTEVRVFTARASRLNPRRAEDLYKIAAWCEDVFGRPLPVTNEKDFEAIAIYDDLAIQVIPNEGLLVS